MFELADYLVGIYKVEDCTRSLTIQNTDKLRILGIGEKEGEKENLADNSFDSLKSPEKQPQVNGNVSIQKESLINGEVDKDASMVNGDVSMTDVEVPVVNGETSANISAVDSSMVAS
jgi:hypothetical protein